MHSIMLLGTAAAVLTAATAFAGPASAERVCRQICDAGFCRTQCSNVNTYGDRDYNRDRYRDRDYYGDRRPGVELRVPGVGIELGR
jgi:hypothetical protein